MSVYVIVFIGDALELVAGQPVFTNKERARTQVNLLNLELVKEYNQKGWAMGGHFGYDFVELELV